MAASFLGRVLLDIQPFIQATRQARGEWAQFNQNLQDSTVVARGAALALAGVGGVVINSFRQSLNVFAEFEQGLKNTETAIGIGSDAMDELKEAALQMGNQTQITASTATIALYEMASAGFDAAQSIDAAWGAVALSIATQGDLLTSSKLIASTIRQFSLDASEAARIADIFVNAIVDSPATLESLTAAMKYAGPIARQYGATLTETVVGLELLLDTGLRGEQAGTALRNMFIRLVNPTAKTAAIIEKLELSLEDVNPQIVGMFDAVKNLADANLNAADATSIFGVRAINAYLTIARAVQNPEVRLNELRKSMENVGTALAVQDEQLNTFRGSWTLLTSALETTAIRAGEIVGSIFRPFIDILRQLVNAFNAASPSMQAFLIILTGMVGVAIAASGALLLIGSRLPEIRQGMAFAARAIGLFTRSLALATRGIIAFNVASLRGMGRNILTGVANGFLLLGSALGRVSPAAGNAAFNMGLFVERLGTLRLGLRAIPWIFLLVEGFIALNKNSHAVTEAFKAIGASLKAVWEGLAETLDAVFTAETGFGRFIRQLLGVDDSFKSINPIVEVFGMIIRGLSGILVIAGAQVEKFGAQLAILGNLIRLGPKAAMEEYQATLADIDNSMFERLERIFNPQPIEDMKNAIKTLEPVVDDINAIFESFGPASDETSDFDIIVAQIAALDELRGKYEGNADALSLINAEMVKLEDRAAVVYDNMLALQRAVAGLVDEFTNELIDLDISLIADDETRKIAEAQRRYLQFFNEVTAAANENPYFREEADRLIAERQRLLQVEITQIQQDGEEERLKSARDNLDKILALHERAEERIRNLRLAMASDGRVRLRMEYENSLDESRRFYAEYIAELEAAGADTKEAMERQREERKLLDVTYLQDVMDLYRDFYAQLHETQSQLDQSAVNLGVLSEPDRLQRELTRNLREIGLRFTELREQMEGDEAAITRLIQQETAARELAQLEYLKAIEDAYRAYQQRRADMQDDIRGEVIDLLGSDSQRALFDFIGGVNRTVAAYEQLADEARKYGRDVQSVYDELHQALLVKEAAFQREMEEITREANRDRLEDAISTASDQLANATTSQLRALQAQVQVLRDAFSGDSEALSAIEGFADRVEDAIGSTISAQAQNLNARLESMSRDTLTQLRIQVEAWREAYGDNSEARRAIEGSIDAITQRIESLDNAFEESLNSIIENSRQFADTVRGDFLSLDLSETDRQLVEFLDRAGEATAFMAQLRNLLPQATAEQTTAIQAMLERLSSSVLEAASVGVEAAERLAREAVEAYNTELAAATSEASQRGVEAITGLVDNALSRIVSVNVEALTAARTELQRLVADMSALGFTDESLAPLRAHITDVEGILRRYSINLAEFAAQQFTDVRRVADAVLSEADARNVIIQTLRDEIEFREEALAVTERLAREGVLSGDDVLSSRRAVVQSQLEYVQALEDERDALNDNLDTAVRFSEVITERLGVDGISTLEGMRDVLISQILAMQEAGAAFEDYSALLAQAEGINSRIMTELEEANERARNALAESASRTQSQAEALDTLRSAEREHIELQIESIEVSQRQTEAYRDLIASIEASGRAYEQQVGSLAELVDRQLALGDVDSAIDSQRDLVNATDRRADSIREEVRALEARAAEMRQLIADNNEAKESLDDLITSIVMTGTFGAPEEEAFDPSEAARRRRELINQLDNQNLTLDEQMELLSQIDDLTKQISESDRQINLSLRERQTLYGFQDEVNAQLDAQNAAAEEQIRLADEASTALREQLVAVLDQLAVAVGELNTMLSNLFATVAETTVFDSIFDNALRGAERLPQAMSGILTRLNEVEGEADVVKQALAEALNIEGFAEDGEASVEQIRSSLEEFGRTDFAQLGGTTGAAFREGFDEQAELLVNNLIEQVGAGRLNEALMEWQRQANLPQVGLELGKPIGEQAVNALIAAIQAGYDPEEFLTLMRQRNQRAAASVGASAEELGEVAGREASLAMLMALTSTLTGGEGPDATQFLADALPPESMNAEGERIGDDVLEGIISSLSAPEKWEEMNTGMSEALRDNLVSPITDMGMEAGTSFVNSLAISIRENSGVLLGAIRTLLGGVDDFLPHSDARKGPLSTLSRSGAALAKTFGRGALSQRDWLARNVGAALGAAMPRVGAMGGLGTAPHIAPGAAGGPVVVNVDGRTEMATGPFAVNARKLVSQVDRELKVRGLRKRE